ncbi:MAG TPA: 3-deoxy-7-phosphoheptulonate synthase, partial [bacterium]|nr:3-deoxy-7-phosphoheptulonate synthase [bacterium]
MIIVMKGKSTSAQVDEVIGRVQAMGYNTHVIWGVEKTVIGAVGDERGKAQLQALISMPGVESVVPILKPYKLGSRQFKSEDTVISVGGVKIGGPEVVVIAGPCSVESREQLLETARIVKAHGAHILRGGAFKPRTSPYAFQGMAEEGLRLLAEAREETGLPIITEVMNPEEVDLVNTYADIL